MKKIIIALSFAICSLHMGIAQYPYDTPYNVYTPHGTTVSVMKFIGTDWDSVEVATRKADLERDYPGAIVVGDATKNYNCHSYAWYMSENINADTVWMDHPTFYFSDNSYGYDNTGTKVVYGYKPTLSFNHSAIAIGNGLLRSKWGDGPLVEHTWDNVPEGYKILNEAGDSLILSIHSYERTPAVISGNNSEVCYNNATFTLNTVPRRILVLHGK